VKKGFGFRRTRRDVGHALLFPLVPAEEAELALEEGRAGGDGIGIAPAPGSVGPEFAREQGMNAIGGNGRNNSFDHDLKLQRKRRQ